MKNKVLLSICVLLLSSGCSVTGSGETSSEPERQIVTIVGYNGLKEYQIDITDVDNYKFEMESDIPEDQFFMGCYESNDLSSTKYVDSGGNGKIYNKEEYPTKLYANYITRSDYLTFKSNNNTKDVSFASRGDNKFVFSFDEGYYAYLRKYEYSTYVQLSFEHHEVEEGVAGVSTFNWTDYTFKNGKRELDAGVCRYNSDKEYIKYNKLFEVSYLEFQDGFTLDLVRPDSCVSTGRSVYSNLSLKVHAGTDEEIAKHKYDNILYSRNSAYLTIQNPGVVLNGSYSTRGEIDYQLPFNALDYVKNVKYSEEATDRTVSFLVSSYGQKGLFSNWCDYVFTIYDENDNVIKEEKGSFGNNSAFVEDTVTTKVSQEDFEKIHHFKLAFAHPGNNASPYFYYIKTASIRMY